MSVKRDYETFSPERLQSAAATLFYTQGYSVGLNDILEKAGIYKATFYKYYDSKDALAADYIDRKRDELVTMLGQLMAKRPKPADFFDSWVKLLAKSSRSPDFYGCPFSNLFAQTLRESPALVSQLKRAVTEIVQYLARYLGSERLAWKVFTLYEGAMTMYNLTGEKAAFSRLAEDLKESLGH